MSLTGDHDKTLDKVRKLVTLAGRTSNAHERVAAARRAVAYLDAHPAPLRWRVPATTPVKVLDDKWFVNGEVTKGKTKDSTARGENWFFETHRTRGEAATKALQLGWLMFQRHGKVIFVEASKVEVHL